MILNTLTMLSTITNIHLHNSFYFVKLKLYSHYTLTPHFPPPPALGNHRYIFCICDLDYSKYLTEVESYSICLFVTGLFHLA